MKALILLSSLLLSWETMVTTIRNSFGKEKLKYDDVRNLILSESSRRRESGESMGGTYSSESRGIRNRQKGNASHGRSKSRGHGKSNGGAHVVFRVVVMKGI